jgi:hypothetical protein
MPFTAHVRRLRRLFDLTNGWDGKPAAGEHFPDDLSLPI